MNKVSRFFENAKLLNKELHIIPLMYGSLGLEYLTGENLHADDVDILIPGTFLNEKWSELIVCLEKAGYKLVDEEEHTFEKEKIHFSYAAIESLTPFAGIEMDHVSERAENTILFKLLSLEQYLKVYQASSKDGYRVNERGKKDQEKIEFICRQLQNSVNIP